VSPIVFESEYETLQPDNDPLLRASYWELAKGLQKTDGLDTSSYLEEVIAATIDGSSSMQDARTTLDRHYAGVSYGDPRSSEMEADKVSARIVELLEKSTFQLSPVQLKSIHRFLFADIFPFDWVGQWRSENIAKRQSVLGGRSVQYASFEDIDESVNYEMDRQRSRNYTLPLDAVQLSSLIAFTADLWLIHPFRDGNTRSISTFLILYLKSLGISITNEPFAQDSEWFRNALVRYNYVNLAAGIEADSTPLVMFFENLIFDTGHKLEAFDLTCTDIAGS